MSKTEDRPPLVCDYCYEHPLHSKYDVHGEQFYCPHRENGTLAIRTLEGWLIRTGVSAEEYGRRTRQLEKIWREVHALYSPGESS
jgi:hypothetical protein